MKYIDLIAYPIMIAVVYVLVGMALWNSNPADWKEVDREFWIIAGLLWGWALQCRIKKTDKKEEHVTDH